MNSPVRSSSHSLKESHSSENSTRTSLISLRHVTLSKVLKFIRHVEIILFFFIIVIQTLRLVFFKAGPENTNWVATNATAVRFPNMLVQSSSLFCSEFGRELSLSYDMDAKWVAIGVLRCLRVVHPHQSAGGGIQALVSYTADSDNSGPTLYNASRSCHSWSNIPRFSIDGADMIEDVLQDDLPLLRSGKYSYAPVEDVLAAFADDPKFAMIAEAFRYWTNEGRSIPVSASLANAIRTHERRLIWSKPLQPLVNNGRRVEGDLLEWNIDSFRQLFDVSNTQKVAQKSGKLIQLSHAAGKNIEICGVDGLSFASHYAARLIKEMALYGKNSSWDPRSLKFLSQFYGDMIQKEKSVYKEFSIRSGDQKRFLLDEYDLPMVKEKFNGLTYDDDGTSLVNVVDPGGGLASAVSSLYDAFGSLGYARTMLGTNNLMKLMTFQENKNWQNTSFENLAAAVAPLLVVERTSNPSLTDYKLRSTVILASGGFWGIMESAVSVFFSYFTEGSLLRAIRFPHIHYYSAHHTQGDEGFSKVVRDELFYKHKTRFHDSFEGPRTLGGIERKQNMITSTTKSLSKGEPLFSSGY